MHIKRAIERLGYSAHEATLYLTSLRIGAATVTELAAAAQMPRTTVQEILAKMSQEGLMNRFLKGRRTFWLAANPNHLLSLLQEREASLRSILPDLHALRSHEESRPSVRVFQGLKEVRLLYEDIIATKRHILCIMNWDQWVKLIGKSRLRDIIEERYKHFLQMRLLTPRTPATLTLKKYDIKELRVTKFLPSRLPVHVNIFVYGHKTALIPFTSTTPTSIVIENEATAEMMRHFFEAMWAQSSA